MICIRSFLQEIRFLSLSYWWWCLFMFPLESPFPFFILHVHLCYELNDFLFCFLFFSCCFWWSYNNIVAGICQYIFVFLCYYFYLFVLLGVYILWFVCIFYYFLLIYAIVKLWRTGWYVANGRSWRTGGAGEASEV